MIDEAKFSAKLEELLKRPHYSSLPTFAVDPLINSIVEAAKECESETVEEENEEENEEDEE